MKVANFPTQVSKQKTTLILGSFEAFHNGHLSLFKKAREFNLPISIMLIKNPLALPKKSPYEYQELAIRLQNLANLGVDFVSLVTFGPKMQTSDGESFIKQLVYATSAKHIVAGKDFAFGKNRQWDSAKMTQHFTNFVVVKHEKVNGLKISTYLLKEAAALGEVDLIRELSPFSYTLEAQIRTKGFFKWGKTIVLQSGVYAAWSIVDNYKYYAYVHLGLNKEPRLIIPQLKEKQYPFNAQIQFLKLTRLIMGQEDDFLTQADFQKIVTFFKNEL